MSNTIVNEVGDVITISVYEAGVTINNTGGNSTINGTEILRKGAQNSVPNSNMAAIELNDTVGFYDDANSQRRVEGIVTDVANYKLYDAQNDRYPNLKLYTNKIPQQ